MFIVKTEQPSIDGYTNYCKLILVPKAIWNALLLHIINRYINRLTWHLYSIIARIASCILYVASEMTLTIYQLSTRLFFIETSLNEMPICLFANGFYVRGKITNLFINKNQTDQNTVNDITSYWNYCQL